jgi:predicted transcriptional regulator
VPVSTIDPDVVAQADRILERHVADRGLHRTEALTEEEHWMAEHLRGMAFRDWERLVVAQENLDRIWGVAHEPAPVKADSFDEWERKTAALLEECEKQKR